MGAVEVLERSFRVVNPRKLILYWACTINLRKDIAYRTRLDMSVEEVEALIPTGAVFTAFLAFKFSSGRRPQTTGRFTPTAL